MKDQILVLAVTKMLSGMCLGGISFTTGEWVRPVKEFGTILPRDLTYRDGTRIQPFDIAEFTLGVHRPKLPHVEDWTCDFVRSRPELVNRPDAAERLAFLDQFAEPEGMNDIDIGKRSLCLLGACETQALFTLDRYSGKYEARFYFPGLSTRTAPVTDIKWRALGRKLTQDSERVTLRQEDFQSILGVKRVYPAVGLSRLYEGRHWPLVIGVHCAPDYESEIDYGNL